METPVYIPAIQSKIRISLIVFIILLILSGVTVFPLETELKMLNDLFVSKNASLFQWIKDSYSAVHDVKHKYLFLFYGTDWLGFAHIVIAVAFIGPLINPVKNIWVIQFGMIACLMVFPMAFIAGHFRDIPLFWRMIDCSFGVFGLIPLWICYKNILILEKFENLKFHV